MTVGRPWSTVQQLQIWYPGLWNRKNWTSAHSGAVVLSDIKMHLYFNPKKFLTSRSFGDLDQRSLVCEHFQRTSPLRLPSQFNYVALAPPPKLRGKYWFQGGSLWRLLQEVEKSWKMPCMHSIFWRDHWNLTKSRKENPQKLTQLSSRSHPRRLVGKRTAQKDTIGDITSDSQVNSNFPYRLSPAKSNI